MKKIALVLTLACFAPIASAASANVATFDFWAWVASLFANESASTESTAIAAPVLDFVQDEGKNFSSIIR